eukprot:3135185-Pyramimonas_sp.AAC.1
MFSPARRGLARTVGSGGSACPYTRHSLEFSTVQRPSAVPLDLVTLCDALWVSTRPSVPTLRAHFWR